MADLKEHVVTRIQIDINYRDRDGHTPADYTGSAPEVGEHVVAFEPEDGVRADAVVLSVNPARSLVVLDVDWDSMTDDHPAHGPTQARDTTTGTR